MEDTELVDLLWSRNNDALLWVSQKYGKLCVRIARNILPSIQDAEECVDDALLALWNSVPPNRPKSLGGYLSTLVRNTCLTRYRQDHSQKRGGGQVELALDELAEILPAKSGVEQNLEARALTDEVNKFLSTLSKDDRIIFLYRYWLMLSAPEIAARFGYSQSKIGSSLHRSRKKLKAHLIKEEWI